ncbi:neuraminidase-like domain-containing protein [Pseudomonas sp. S31]|uniref:Tc toxin subunit A-related protein n=1 Tax=Pseudomonas sp. S31 TaxID=1564473 RepID=UPI00191408F4|nr:neuraminidase-like domain-containing protein [Pseudomonas sp. S31]
MMNKRCLAAPDELIKKAGFSSLAAAGELSCEELREALEDEISPSQTEELLAMAQSAHHEALLQEKRILTHSSPLLPAAIEPPSEPNAGGYQQWFGERAGRYAAPGDVASMFSPAAYLVQLYHHAQNLYPQDSPWHIDARRPDLKALVLSQANLDTPVSALSLSNEILLSKAGQGSEPTETVLQRLADHVGSRSTPHHHHYSRLRELLLGKDPHLACLRAAPEVVAPLGGDAWASLHYDIPPALQRLLVDPIDENNAEEKFATYFPGKTPEAMLSPQALRAWSGLGDEDLQALMGKLDETQFLGNSLTARAGNQFFRVTATKSNGVDTIETFYLLPKGDDQWEIRVKYKTVPHAFNRHTIKSFNDERLSGVEIDARQQGDQQFVRGKEYVVQFKYPYAKLKEGFSVNSYQHAGAGYYNYWHSVKFERLSPALYLLRLNKLIRLHKATQLPRRVLEDIIDSVNPLEINHETLAVLSQVAQISEQYGIEHEEALLTAKGLISQKARPGEKSHFDRLFNDPTLAGTGFRLDGKPTPLNPATVSDRGDVLATLKRACQTDHEGLYELGRCLAANQGEAVTVRSNLAQVSALYTLSLWARLHGLAPAELRQLLQLIGLPDALHQATSDDWLKLLRRLSDTVGWLHARNWRVHDLWLMTRDVSDIPAGAEIDNLRKVMTTALDGLKQLTLDDCLGALAPSVASAFGLGGEAAATALLIWADRAKPGDIGLLAACQILQMDTPDAAQMKQVTGFAYGLAQMALIIHGSDAPTDVMASLVVRPQWLASDAVQGSDSDSDSPSTVTLARSLPTIMALAELSDWLKHLPDLQGAGGALLTAMAAGQGISLATLATASGQAPAALAQAGAQAKRLGHLADATQVFNWREIEVLRRWTTLADALDVMPDDLGRLARLPFTGSDSQETDLAAWREVANAFLAGVTPTRMAQVEDGVQAPLSQALAGMINSRDNITQERLDQQLLLDAANGPQVMTSRIAEATSALQMFIHRCQTQPEDKYTLHKATLDRPFFRDWTRWNARYASWAAGQMLMFYPENYIDPTVRLGQTKAMDDMLQALGQAQINGDTVGDAFHGYLSAFEEVADLETVSGYHDSRKENSGKSWFIGRSRGGIGEYWWRTVDESKRGVDGVLPANAWSSWTRIDLAPKVEGRLIRPVVFRERLYLGWIERQEQGVPYDAQGKPGTSKSRWVFKLSWQRYDGNWSAPQDYDLALGGSPDPEQLALFFAARPGRNSVVMSIYDPSSHSPLKVHAGLEVFEDLTATAGGTAAVLEQVSHWLDTKDHKGMCAVFDDRGQPVSENSLSVSAGSGLPTGFATFEPIDVRARVQLIGDGQPGRYRLQLDSRLNVQGKSATRPNRWAKALVRHYADLANEQRRIPMLTRGHRGAHMQRSADGSFWGYFCLDAAHLQSLVPRADDIRYIADPDFPDKKGEVEKIWTPTGDCYVGRYSSGYDNPLYGIKVIFLDAASRQLTPACEVIDLIGQPANLSNPDLSPQEYVSAPDTVLAAEVTCEIHGIDGKGSVVTSAMRDYALHKGAKQIPLSITADVGDTAHWNGEAEAFHLIRYQCGRGNTRDYVLRVYKVADTLRTAVIGSTNAGAQYLERNGWVTRLNTLFARQLTERAVSGLDTILSYETQHLAEPAIGISVNLALPVYDPSYHGNNRNAEVWLATSPTNRSMLWRGRLSEQEKTAVAVTFAAGAKYLETGHYYLETAYQKVHYQGPTRSVIIDGQTLKVLLSADAAPGSQAKLDKRNVDAVVVRDPKGTTPMDFSGANALYFWELFYYTPMMVMQRFLQEERFELAEQWLKYVFNPAGYTVGGHYTARLWNVRPLADNTAWNSEPLTSRDPDAVAQNDPMHYKLNAFMRLLDITIGRGDAAYRKLERDTLSEAKVWYQRALDLLGEAPWVPPASGWDDPRLGESASTGAFNSHFHAIEQLIAGQSPAQQQNPAYLDFLPEANRVMLGYWETLRLRLFNLRNNLTLDGQPLNLPLYAKPADPKALLAAAVAAQAGREAQLPDYRDVPALRFSALLDGARSMVSQLIQFGSTMQGILERQDAEALAGLLTSQGAELANSSVAWFKQTLNELAAERITLEKSLEAATLRRDHYRQLFDNDISAREMQALNMKTAAAVITAKAPILEGVGAALDLIPNIFGLANGGHQPSSLPKAAGKMAEGAAKIMAIASDRINQEEIYRRRRSDWEFQAKTAEQDRLTIQAQMETLAARTTSAQMHLEHLGTQAAHAQAQLALHQGKFTGKAMLSWLRARLASIFYTYYDLAATRCVMAQKALQWEMNDTTTYLRTGTWNGAWAGLLCGEGLMLALGQMESAWVKWHKRELEVTRTVDLDKVFAGNLKMDDQVVTLSEAVRAVLASKEVKIDSDKLDASMELAINGTLSIRFGLKALGLATGFENAQARRVRSIAVSMPCLLGPYQDVHARLLTDAPGLPLGCNQAAISHATKDNGLVIPPNGYSPQVSGMQLLPFEGLHIPKSDDDDKTSLTLNFANANGEQRALLESLSNVILHVHFTVR